MTENDFKTRFNNHKLSFRNQNHSIDTVLSKYIWELKNNDTTWHQVAYHEEGKRLQGKPITLQFVPFWETLYLDCLRYYPNKWSTLVTKCRQENKFFTTSHRMQCSNRPWISNFLSKNRNQFSVFLVWWSLNSWNSELQLH